MKYILTILLASICLFTKAQAPPMNDVFVGEYQNSFKSIFDRVYMTANTGGIISLEDCGLSGITYGGGGQYHNIAGKGSTKQIWDLRRNTAQNKVITKITNLDGTDFLCDSAIGFFQSNLYIKNGEIWYSSNSVNVDGRDPLNQNGGVDNRYPYPLIQPPGSRTVIDVVAGANTPPSGAIAIVRCSDNTLWQYDRTRTTPIQLSYSGTLLKVTQVGYFATVIETTTDLLARGYFASYVGGTNLTQNGPFTSIKAKYVAAGVKFPLIELKGGYHTMGMIDALNNQYWMGSNVNGEFGNGLEYNPYRTRPTFPWLWNFANGELVATAPVYIPGKIQHLYLTPNIAFYSFVMDMGGKLYSKGRNKNYSLANGEALVIGNGTDAGGGQDKFPNGLDQPFDGEINLNARYVLRVFNPSVQQAPRASAGIDQYITTDTSRLWGQGSSKQEGTITSRFWTQLSGPNTVSIATAAIANTPISGLVAGTYTFEERVTDQNGVIDRDTVSVTTTFTPPTTPDITNTYSAFVYSYIQGNGPSLQSNTFSILGSSLSPTSGNIIVTPSTNFEVYDGSTWQSSAFNIAYTGGTISTSSIYRIRLKAGLTANTYSENITINGGGASSTIPVTGSVLSAPTGPSCICTTN